MARSLLFCRVVLLWSLWSLGEACTIIAVGKDASATGYPMVSHSDDSGPSTTDVRLVRVPRRKWPKGSVRKLYEWRIPYPRTGHGLTETSRDRVQDPSIRKK